MWFKLDWDEFKSFYHDSGNLKLRETERFYNTLFSKIRTYFRKSDIDDQDLRDYYHSELMYLIQKKDLFRNVNPKIDLVRFFVYRIKDNIKNSKRSVQLEEKVVPDPLDFIDIDEIGIDLDDGFSVLTVSLSTKWRLKEFGNFLLSFEMLYSLLSSTENLASRFENKFIPDEFVNNYFRPKIVRIVHNSPGSLDILGIGKILEQIKDIIISIINFSQDRELKRLETRKKFLDIEIMEEELKVKKIETARNLLILLKEHGVSEKVTTMQIEEIVDSFCIPINEKNITDVNLK